MTEDRLYRAEDLQLLTLREAVVRRPKMYFGDYAAADWPLVIAAWTATDLLEYVVRTTRRVDVTLHEGGDISAAVTEARVTDPLLAVARPVDVLIRQRMWWHQLGRSTSVTAGRRGIAAGAPQVVGDERLWSDLDIVVRLALDADLFGVEPAAWWQDGAARLRIVFGTDRFRPEVGSRIAITEEATNNTLQVGT